MELQTKIREILTDLIEKQGVNLFYVGNHGNFDLMVKNELKYLSKYYSRIRYFVVLAYLPKNNNENVHDWRNTIYPEGLELTPLRFAIHARNCLMIEWSDYIVTYVKHSGGAEKYQRLAMKKERTVINLA